MKSNTAPVETIMPVVGRVKAEYLENAWPLVDAGPNATALAAQASSL